MNSTKDEETQDGFKKEADTNTHQLQIVGSHIMLDKDFIWD